MLIAQSKVLQCNVNVGERHREGARGGAAVAILPRQRERRLSIGCHPGRKGHANDGARSESNPLAQGADRIEHGAGRARQGSAIEDERHGE